MDYDRVAWDANQLTLECYPPHWSPLRIEYLTQMAKSHQRNLFRNRNRRGVASRKSRQCGDCRKVGCLSYSVEGLAERPRFFDLPAELRDMVYNALYDVSQDISLVFYNRRVRVSVSGDSDRVHNLNVCLLRNPNAEQHMYYPLLQMSSFHMAFLQTSRQIYEEASAILYERNRFVLLPFALQSTNQRENIDVRSAFPRAFPLSKIKNLTVAYALCPAYAKFSDFSWEILQELTRLTHLRIALAEYFRSYPWHPYVPQLKAIVIGMISETVEDLPSNAKATLIEEKAFSGRKQKQ